MASISVGLSIAGASISPPAKANLCTSVRDKSTTTETRNDVNFFRELFPDSTDRGDDLWNRMVLQCNRQRDTKGREIGKVTASPGNNAGKTQLKSGDLGAKVIRGHYNFFGLLAAQLRYVYVLSKTGGVWEMVIPYRPIINDVVKNRVDFNSSHAGVLYDSSQVANAGGELVLRSGARPISQTLCASSTYFAKQQGKYDKKELHRRDKENKFISLGKIEYKYTKNGGARWGCRVADSRDLFWRSDSASTRVSKVKPRDWILDNFVRTVENYWKIDGLFRLRLLMKGHNDSSFPASMRALLKDDDHLTVRFATKFLPYKFNQMYKSNIVQFNNFSTMTTDGTYWHEVGHAFGLDDEYGKVTKDGDARENGCESPEYDRRVTATYQMCEAGATEKRQLYHYLAVSRYATKQNECDNDAACGTGRYCDRGTITIGKNQCVPLKANNAACAAIGGGKQCASGQCRSGRCYSENSVAMGGTCYADGACRQGKCSAADGFRGVCVCKKDSDCGSGRYCDGGLDLKRNACRAKLENGQSCGKVASVGNDRKCLSGKCSGFPNYKCK